MSLLEDVNYTVSEMLLGTDLSQLDNESLIEQITPIYKNLDNIASTLMNLYFKNFDGSYISSTDTYYIAQFNQVSNNIVTAKDQANSIMGEVAELGIELSVTELMTSTGILAEGDVATIPSIVVTLSKIVFHATILLYNTHQAALTTAATYNTMVDDLNQAYTDLYSLGLDDYNGQYSAEVEDTLAHISNLSSDRDLAHVDKINKALSLSNMETQVVEDVYLEIVRKDLDFVYDFWSGENSSLNNYLTTLHLLRDTHDKILEEDAHLSAEYTTKLSSTKQVCENAYRDYKYIPGEIYYLFNIDYDDDPSQRISMGLGIIDSTERSVRDDSVGAHISSLYKALTDLSTAETECKEGVKIGNSIMDKVYSSVNSKYDQLYSRSLTLEDPDPIINYNLNKASRLISSSGKPYERLNNLVQAYQLLTITESAISAQSTSSTQEYNLDSLKSQYSSCRSQLEDLITSAEMDGLSMSDYRPVLMDLSEGSFNSPESLSEAISKCRITYNSVYSKAESFYTSQSYKSREIYRKMEHYPELKKSNDYTNLIQYLDTEGNLLFPKSLGHLSQIKGYLSSLESKMSITERSNFISSLQLYYTINQAGSPSLDNPSISEIVAVRVYSPISCPNSTTPYSAKLPVDLNLNDYSFESSDCDITPITGSNYLTLTFTTFPEEGCTFKFKRTTSLFSVKSYYTKYLSPTSFEEAYSLKLSEDYQLNLLPKYNFTYIAYVDGLPKGLSTTFDLSKGTHTIKFVYDVPNGIQLNQSISKETNSYKLTNLITNNLPVTAEDYNLVIQIPKTDTKKPVLDVKGCTLSDYTVEEGSTINSITLKIASLPPGVCTIDLIANYQFDKKNLQNLLINLSKYESIPDVNYHLARARAYIDSDLSKAYDELLKAQSAVNNYQQLNRSVSKLDSEFNYYSEFLNSIENLTLPGSLSSSYSSFKSSVEKYKDCQGLDDRCKSSALSHVRDKFNAFTAKVSSESQELSGKWKELSAQKTIYSKYIECDLQIRPYPTLSGRVTSHYISQFVEYYNLYNEYNLKLSTCEREYNSYINSMENNFKSQQTLLKTSLDAYQKACDGGSCNDDLVKESTKYLSYSGEITSETIDHIEDIITSLDTATARLQEEANNKLLLARSHMEKLRSENPPNLDVYDRELKSLEKLYEDGNYYKVISGANKFLTTGPSGDNSFKLILAGGGLLVLSAIVVKIYLDKKRKKSTNF